MITVIIRRLGLGVLAVAVIAVVVFGATQALPGDIANQLLGANATPESLRNLRDSLGLNRPILVQFVQWAAHFLRGDFGVSLANNTPVIDLIGPRIVATLLLALAAFVPALVISVLTGVSAAMWRDSWFDRVFIFVTTLVSGIPEFVIGVVLAVIVVITGWTAVPPVSNLNPFIPIGDQLNMLVLPAATLVLASIPIMGRMVRTTMADQLGTEYVMMAHLNGLSPFRILRQVALPNALPAFVQEAGLVVRYLAGGVVMVEVVFSYPGLGVALVDAVQLRDIAVVQFVSVVLAVVIVVSSLVADLIAAALTPKVRTTL